MINAKIPPYGMNNKTFGKIFAKEGEFGDISVQTALDHCLMKRNASTDPHQLYKIDPQEVHVRVNGWGVDKIENGQSLYLR